MCISSMTSPRLPPPRAPIVPPGMQVWMRPRPLTARGVLHRNENRNLMWTKRGKARLILIFSTNTNCENMACRSFRSEKCSGCHGDLLVLTAYLPARSHLLPPGLGDTTCLTHGLIRFTRVSSCQGPS